MKWNTLPAFIIGVLVVWGLIFALGYAIKGPSPGHPLLNVFGGFLLGMLAMYIAMRVYPATPSPR